MEADIVFGDDGEITHNHAQPIEPVIFDSNRNVVSDHVTPRSVLVEEIDDRKSSSRNQKKGHGMRPGKTIDHGLTSTFDIDLRSPTPTFKDSRTISPAFHERLKNSEHNNYASASHSARSKRAPLDHVTLRKDSSITLDDQDNDSGFYGVDDIDTTKFKFKSRRHKDMGTATSASSKSSSLDSRLSSRMSCAGKIHFELELTTSN